jgi:hypothetical protein
MSNTELQTLFPIIIEKIGENQIKKHMQPK